MKRILIMLLLIIAVVAGIWLLMSRSAVAPTETVPSNSPTSSLQASPTAII